MCNIIKKIFKYYSGCYYLKLRVGLLNDSFAPMIDGVAVATKAYGDIIKQKHGEPIVIVPKYPNIIDDYDYKVYRYHSVPSDKLIGYRAGNPFSPTLVNRLRNERMDLLHVHCPFASAVMARVICSSAKSKVPMVFTYHTKFNTDIKTRVKIKQIQKIAHRFVLNNINHMDEVWVVSKNAGEDLREFGYKGNYRIMRNGTDYEKGKSPKERIDEIDRIYRIEPCELVFLFVGRMMWYKNLKIIIDSLKILKNKGIRFRMLFVGDGKDRPAVEKYAAQQGLKGYVEFTGAIYDREKLRDYYSRADLFLFPSTYDTCGLVVMEAAACDCPSVLVKNSCAAETVEDNVSGFLCEENAYSCAKTIAKAVSDLDHLKQVGKNASDMVYYSWEDAVDVAYKRYEEIVKANRISKRRIKELQENSLIGKMQKKISDFNLIGRNKSL